MYGNEVSLEQYLTYTTEKPEKTAIEYYVAKAVNYEEGLKRFVKDFKIFGDKMEDMVALVNLYKEPMDDDVFAYYRKMKSVFKDGNILKMTVGEMQETGLTFKELIATKKYGYEKV